MKRNEARDYVAKRLLNEEDYVLFALTFLYGCQTQAEQRISRTFEPNEQGFNVVDAKRFTKLAEAAIPRGHLKPDELSKCRNLDSRGLPVLAKYWKQIWSPPEELQIVMQVPRKPPTSEYLAEETRKEEYV